MEVMSMDSRTKLPRSESSHITLEIFLFCLQFLNCKMEMLSYFINSNVHTFPYFNFFKIGVGLIFHSLTIHDT